MRFLLDSCTALWFFEGNETLAPALIADLTDPTNELWLSDVSILEIVVKYRLGKLPLSQPPSRVLPVLAEKHLMDILPLTTEAIFALEKLPALHRDPFDRLLVAQARTHGLILVTPDSRVRQYPVETRW